MEIRSKKSKTTRGLVCHEAAARGDLSFIKSYLSEDVTDLDEYDDVGKTPLMNAAEKGHLSCVIYLCNLPDTLSYQVDINESCYDGKTALMFAAKNGHLECVKYLCNLPDTSTYQVDITRTDDDGKTALMFAAENGQLECVKYLCGTKSKAVLKIDDFWSGNTALTLAAKNGYLDCVRYLYETGVFRAIDHALVSASMGACFECVQYLLTKLSPEENIITSSLSTLILNYDSENRDSYNKCLELFFAQGVNIQSCNQRLQGRSAIMIEAKHGNIEGLKILLQNSCDMSCTDSNGKTVIFYAIKSKNTDCFRFILNHGLDVTNRTKDGKTVIMQAAKCEAADILEILFNVNDEVDINVMDKNRTSALGYLYNAKRDHDQNDFQVHNKILKMLLDHGADPNIDRLSFIKSTPLMFEAKWGNIEGLKLLIRHGCNISITDKYDQTALWYATSGNNSECFQSLLDSGAEIKENCTSKTVIMQAVESEASSILEVLLKLMNDIDINAKCKRGISALGYLYTERDQNYLTEYNDEVDMNEMDTALGYLYNAERDRNQNDFQVHNKILKMLLEHGADPNSVRHNSNHRSTPIVLEAKWGNVTGFQILLEYNAEVNVIACNENYSSMNVSALSYAVQNRNVECVKMLLERDADVDVTNENGCPLLSTAIESRCCDILNLLIDYHSNINQTSSYKTPLACAIEHKFIDGLKILLANGADVDLRFGDGEETALMKAAELKSHEILWLLIEKNASINLTDTFENTALTYLYNTRKGPRTFYCDQLLDQEDSLVNISNQEWTEHNRCLELLLEKGANSKSGERSALIIEARNGNIEGLKLLLRHGCDIFYTDHNGRTALSYAIMSKNTDCFRFLLNAGLDVTKLTKYGENFIMQAVKFEAADVLEIILNVKKDIDINEKDMDGTSALGYLYFGIDKNDLQEHNKILRLLLDHGADPNLSRLSNSEFTPLMSEAARGNIEGLKFLMRHDCNLSPTDRNEETAIWYTIKGKHTECFQCLFEAGTDVKENINKKTVIMQAVESKTVSILEILFQVKSDIDINAECARGMSALGYLYKSEVDQRNFEEHNKILRMLLYHGGDPNVRVSRNSSTPLMLEAKWGNVEGLKLLLSHDCDLSFMDSNGETALWYAIKSKNTECFKCILDAGAEIKQNGIEKTVTMQAVESETTSILELLLKLRNDIDINAKCKTGQTALGYLYKSEINFIEHNKVLRMLLEHGANPNSVIRLSYHRSTPLMLETKRGNVIGLQYLLEYDAEVNVINEHYNNMKVSALSYAVQNRNIECVKMLLEKDADVEVTNEKGYPLLSTAIESRCCDILTILINYNSNINQKSRKKTPLACAVEQKYIDGLKILLANGADVDLRFGDSEETVLMRAASLKSHEILTLLLEKNASVNLTDAFENTALAYLYNTRKGFRTFYDQLLYHEDYDRQPYQKESYVEWTEHNRCLELLLEKGAKAECGEISALMLEAKNGNFDGLKLVLNCGGDLSFEDQNGETALWYAIKNNNTECIKFLLSAGLDQMKPNTDQQTVIMCSAANKDADILELLLKSQVELDINLKCSKGKSALAYLYKNCEEDGYYIDNFQEHNKMMKMLLDHGADPNVKIHHSNDMTPLMLESKWGNIQGIQYLIQMHADVNASTESSDFGYNIGYMYGKSLGSNRALKLAIQKRSVECVKLLIENGADIDLTDAQDNQLLRLSIEAQSLDLLRLLSDLKIDVNRTQKTSMFETPLATAAKLGNVEFVKFLLTIGASVDTQFGQNEATALMYAAEGKEPEILRLLIENHADVKMTDGRGKTALSYMYGKRDSKDQANDNHNLCLEILLKHGADPNVSLDDFLSTYRFRPDSDVHALRFPIFREIRNSNKKGLELLVSYQANIRTLVQLNDENLSPLNFCLYVKSIDCATVLLKNGVDPNHTTTKDGKTSLMFSVENNFYDGIKLLIDYGAYINAKSVGGMTALIFAASSERCDSKVAELLLTNKANPNDVTTMHTTTNMSEPDIQLMALFFMGVYALPNMMSHRQTEEESLTSLMLAVKNGKINMVKSLLKHGANVKQINSKGYQALSYTLNRNVFAKGCLEVLLQSGANPNICGYKTQQSLLICAAEQGDLETLKMLITNGANGSLNDQNGLSALHYACENKHNHCITYLIKNGLDPDAKNNEEVTPLMIASRNKDDKTIIDLIQNGAEVNICDQRKQNAISYLMDAYSRYKKREINICLKTLLEHGGDPNVDVGKTGKTPLMIVAEEGNDEGMMILLRHGASVDKVDEHKMCALHFASRKGNIKCIKILTENGSEIEKMGYPLHRKEGLTPLMLASENGNAEVIKYLIDIVTDVNLKNESDKTALSYLKLNMDSLKIFLEKGADPNVITDKNKMTLLMSAARNRNPDIVKLLLDNSADINKTDIDGKSAIAYLAIRANYDNTYTTFNQCLSLFADNGTNLNESACGSSVFSLVVSSGNIDGVKLLLRKGTNLDPSITLQKVGLDSIDMIKILLEEGLCVSANELLNTSSFLRAGLSVRTLLFQNGFSLDQNGVMYDGLMNRTFEEPDQWVANCLNQGTASALDFCKSKAVDNLSMLCKSIDLLNIALFITCSKCRYDIAAKAYLTYPEEAEEIQTTYENSFSLKNQTRKVIRECLIKSKCYEVKISELSGRDVKIAKSYEQKLDELVLPSALKDWVSYKELQEKLSMIPKDCYNLGVWHNTYDFDTYDVDDYYDSDYDYDYDDDDGCFYYGGSYDDSDDEYYGGGGYWS